MSVYHTVAAQMFAILLMLVLGACKTPAIDSGGSAATHRDTTQRRTEMDVWIEDAFEKPQAPQCSREVSEKLIRVFIAEGPAAIPKLMKYVEVYDYTPWVIAPPSASSILNKTRVGVIACYLIEAVLRKEPCFTSSPILCCSAAGHVSYEEASRYCLGQAAREYRDWYRKCFDEKSSIITCDETSTPSVHWGYDCLDASVRGVRSGDMGGADPQR